MSRLIYLSAQAREKLLLLWYHENIRVYSDRLINDEDRQWFDRLLRDTLNDKFSCHFDDIKGERTLFYGDFCDTTGEYEQITDLRKVTYYIIITFNDIMYIM